jgi:hypothetical protein
LYELININNIYLTEINKEKKKKKKKGVRPPGLAGSLDRNDRSGQELASGTLTYEAWACMGLPHMVLATRPSRCHAHAHAIN